MTSEWKWRCLECGKTFKTAKAAENAVSNGCSRCGGSDIDMATKEDVKK